MAPATLRRHLACLVDAGLIIRRNSPNGKRFARRGQGGAIEDAFGFDLTPLVARAEEIENLAEEVRAENRAIALLRENITLTRRDIAKMIATGIEEGVSGDWEGFHLRYAALSGRYARNLIRTDLEALAHELAALATEIRKLLETHVKPQNMSGNESQTERHIQNQITNLSILNLAFKKAGPNRPGSMTKNRGLHRRLNPKSWEQERQSLSKSPGRREPIRSAWCWRPVPISSTSLRAEFPRGGISRQPRRWFEGRLASRPTLGRRRWRFWASTTRRSSSPRSCSAGRKSKAPAAICAF